MSTFNQIWHCRPVPRRLPALAGHVDMGLGALDAATEVAKRDGDSVCPRLHSCHRICLACSLCGGLFSVYLWFPILRSAVNENFWNRILAVGERTSFWHRGPVASEFIALARTCFLTCHTCILDRSGCGRIRVICCLVNWRSIATH